MTTEENKAVVRRFVEEFKNSGDEAVAAQLRSPDFVNHSAPPGAPRGPEGGPALFRARRTAFPDLAVTVDDMLADGDKVVTRQTFSGTHRGEYLGVPATGRRVSWPVIDIVTVVEGRITEHWAVADLHGLHAQLTADPS
ncbi:MULTISPECIES: ester cyclase [unclassified Geodermatophilus]|uniref:ester cyclase n=1 Tax=unclassified Geodermatophilus TaxID=2637632 RepID=UPI003EEA069C